MRIFLERNLNLKKIATKVANKKVDMGCVLGCIPLVQMQSSLVINEVMGRL